MYLLVRHQEVHNNEVYAHNLRIVLTGEYAIWTQVAML